MSPTPAEYVAKYARSVGKYVATPAGRHFVRVALTAGVGIPLAMRPTLGTKIVPGLDALLTLLADDLRREVVPLSIFFVTFVAVAMEFYVGRRIRDRTLGWLFPLVMTLLAIAVTTLFVLQSSSIIKVPVDGRTELVIKTPSRLAGCPCGNLPDLECVHQISLHPRALQTCWGDPALQRVRLALAGSYVLTLTLLTLSIALVVLQAAGYRRRAAERRRRRPRKPKTPPSAA